MKKLLLILLFVPIVAFGQTEKLKETLIKKSIKWTEVASTGRNYEEAIKNANKLGIKERTVYKKLIKYVEDGFVQKKSYGHYKKNS